MSFINKLLKNKNIISVPKKSWKDITVEKFYKIQEILEVQDDYTALNLISAIFDIDAENLPINQLAKYSVKFLNDNVPNVKLKKYYKLNGREYDSSCDLTTLTVAQYIDFNNYSKKETLRYEEMLGVFFIPKGHQYNDGYDMLQVQRDLLTLDICTVHTAAFFFRNQLAIFLMAFQDCLSRQLKNMNLTKEQHKTIESLMEKADWPSLALYLTSQSSVKRQMKK